MKIFRIYKQAEDITCSCLPDTALLNTKQPFFVPDFTERCMATPCLAVRITRLGRSIGKAFSNRYYDSAALTLGVHFVAADMQERLVAQGKPCDMAIGFDSSVAVAPEGNYLAASQASLMLNGKSVSLPVEPTLVPLVDEAIARVSQFFTLRQGDVFLFPLTAAVCPVAIDDKLQLCLDGEKILAFNIK